MRQLMDPEQYSEAQHRQRQVRIYGRIRQNLSAADEAASNSRLSCWFAGAAAATVFSFAGISAGFIVAEWLIEQYEIDELERIAFGVPDITVE
jgi:hypothetical protein